MPCSSLDNTFNPSPIPATPLPGFGIPFSPINPEYPGIKLPDVGAIQSVLELVNNLQFIVSSGVFHLNPNESRRTTSARPTRDRRGTFSITPIVWSN
jgi:hypothetical protein